MMIAFSDGSWRLVVGISIIKSSSIMPHASITWLIGWPRRTGNYGFRLVEWNHIKEDHIGHHSWSLSPDGRILKKHERNNP
jgi:hypothetical protein